MVILFLLSLLQGFWGLWIVYLIRFIILFSYIIPIRYVHTYVCVAGFLQ